MDIMLIFRKKLTLLPFSAKWYAEISRAEEFEASTSWAGGRVSKCKLKCACMASPELEKSLPGIKWLRFNKE